MVLYSTPTEKSSILHGDNVLMVHDNVFHLQEVYCLHWLYGTLLYSYGLENYTCIHFEIHMWKCPRTGILDPSMFAKIRTQDPVSVSLQQSMFNINHDSNHGKRVCLHTRSSIYTNHFVSLWD